MLGVCKTALAAAVFLAAAAGSGSALAQDEAAPSAPAEAARPQAPWVVECSNRSTGDAMVCQMSQLLVAKKNGQRVLSAAITRKPDGKSVQLTLGLPHGLSLPAGVQLFIDNAERMTFPIDTADQNGSYATIDLTPKLLASLKKGTLLNVAVKAKGGNELILQLSLTGFGTALERLAS